MIDSPIVILIIGIILLIFHKKLGTALYQSGNKTRKRLNMPEYGKKIEKILHIIILLFAFIWLIPGFIQIFKV